MADAIVAAPAHLRRDRGRPGRGPDALRPARRHRRPDRRQRAASACTSRTSRSSKLGPRYRFPPGPSLADQLTTRPSAVRPRPSPERATDDRPLVGSRRPARSPWPLCRRAAADRRARRTTARTRATSSPTPRPRSTRAEQAAQQQINKANDALPDRPAGQLDIDGTTTFSLTPAEVDHYGATGTSTTINLARQRRGPGVPGAVRRQDRPGQLRAPDHAAASGRPARPSGLDVVQFQIASDGIVVAIKSESDVGGDCLTTDQVQEIWRAGSPITNWSQVGLDDVPLAVGGPQRRLPDRLPDRSARPSSARRRRA